MSADAARVLGVVLLIFTGCGPHANEAGKTPVRMAVGGQTQFLYLPATLAKQLGYYGDEGLNVTLQDFPGGAKALEALLGGSADVVSGFYDHTIQMAAQGRNLQAFTLMVRYPGFVLAISSAARKPIRSVEQLKGAEVGVTALGSSTHLFLNYVLVKHGLRPGDVSVSSIGGGPSAVAAMGRGKVDAAVMTDPAFSLLLRREPKTAILADLRTEEGVRAAFGTESYPSSVLYSTRDWIDRNPEVARKLAASMKRTLAFIGRTPPEQIAQAMPAEFRGIDPGIYLQSLRLAIPMYSPDGVMPPAGAEAVYSVLSTSMEKVRGGKVDVSQTYTNRFVVR